MWRREWLMVGLRLRASAKCWRVVKKLTVSSTTRNKAVYNTIADPKPIHHYPIVAISQYHIRELEIVSGSIINTFFSRLATGTCRFLFLHREYLEPCLPKPYPCTPTRAALRQDT